MMMKKMKTQQGSLSSSCSSSVPRRRNLSFFIIIPDEIITNNILVRLPSKSILSLKSVCKNWYSLFSDPYFIKLHYNHGVQQDKFTLILKYYNRLYSIGSNALASSNKLTHMTNYPFIPFQSELVFVGFCHGFVCFTHHHHRDGDGRIINRYYIWNPSIDECRILPIPPYDGLRNIFSTISYGFGFYYDYKLDDYKLLKIRTMSNGSYLLSTTVYLYTLGSNSWEQLFSDLYYEIIHNDRGVLVNGALHWMATPFSKEGLAKLSYNVIVSFDVVDERFKEVPMPKFLKKILSSKYVELGVFNEYFCVSDNIRKVSTDVWVMKKYGVSKSWTKLFTILKDSSMRTFFPIKCFRNGDILFQKDGKDLVLYDKLKKTTISKPTAWKGAFWMSCCALNSYLQRNGRPLSLSFGLAERDWWQPFLPQAYHHGAVLNSYLHRNGRQRRSLTESFYLLSAGLLDPDKLMRGDSVGVIKYSNGNGNP